MANSDQAVCKTCLHWAGVRSVCQQLAKYTTPETEACVHYAADVERLELDELQSLRTELQRLRKALRTIVRTPLYAGNLDEALSSAMERDRIAQQALKGEADGPEQSQPES